MPNQRDYDRNDGSDPVPSSHLPDAKVDIKRIEKAVREFRPDHLVIAARSLDEGVGWCEATFGVVPGPGGTHPLMGTHNRLLKIATADFPRAYTARARGSGRSGPDWNSSKTASRRRICWRTR